MQSSAASTRRPVPRPRRSRPRLSPRARRTGSTSLALIDGVAHIGFVASGGPPEYYSDALDRFGIALRLVTEIGSGNLRRAAAHWLRWLRWLTGLVPDRSVSTIGT